MRAVTIWGQERSKSKFLLMDVFLYWCYSLSIEYYDSVKEWLSNSFQALCANASRFLHLRFTQHLFHVFRPWSLNRQIEKWKMNNAPGRIEPGSTKTWNYKATVQYTMLWLLMFVVNNYVLVVMCETFLWNLNHINI